MEEVCSKHLEVIDVLKGITILLVVIGHALGGVISSQHITIMSADNSIFIVKQVIYGFHMPLFFMISGLFIDKWRIKKFILAVKEKFYRLMIPYFLWSAIIAAIMQCALSYTNDGLGIKNFLLSPIIPFSQYWFLYVLFFTTVIYHIIVNGFNKNGKFLYLLLTISLYFFNPLISDFWILGGLCTYMVFFSIGTYILNFINLTEYKCNKTKFIILSIIFLLVNILCIYFLYQENDIHSYFYFFVTSLVGSILIFNISYYLLKYRKITNILSVFGKKSMEVYCSHLIILAGCRIFLLKILKVDNLWGVIIVISLITILASYYIFTKVAYENNKLSILFGMKSKGV